MLAGGVLVELFTSGKWCFGLPAADSVLAGLHPGSTVPCVQLLVVPPEHVDY